MATRRERVILDLQDDFSAKMIKAAGAAALLNRELDSLSGKSAKFDQSSQVFVRDVQKMGREADGAAKSIDRMSGRLGLAADALLLLGPAAIPIGALVVPAVMTLTSSLAALAVGAGTTAIAFGGVGDAIEAANKAHLEPTIENLAAAEELFSKLAPAVEDFAKQFNSMRGLGAEIRNAGAEALFPGLTEALETLESRGPEAIRIMTVFNETVGDIAADAAASLASDKWDDFFAMIEREGPPTLDKTADALGNVVHGISELLEAFAPSTADGMDWLVDLSEDFEKWATGLKRTEGFKDFIEYIRETGPQVADTLSALSRALLDILEAAAPLGGPALKGIESFAEAVSAVADSDLATPLLLAIAAMRTINRLAPVTAGSMALLSGGAGAGAAGAAGGKRGKGRGGAGAGALAFFGATIAADIVTDELGWEEASEKQIAKGKEFAEKWGDTVGGQANKAFFKALGDGLGDVSKFGIFPDTEAATDKLLNAPVEKQIELRKQLHEEYGVGFKALEREGFLLEGTATQVKNQLKSVTSFTDLIKDFNNVKVSPKIDIDDRGAKQKQREADAWFLDWGRKNGKAKADVDGKPAKTILGQIGDLLAQTDDTTAVPNIDINDGNSRGIMADVRAELARLDGTTATTYINTVRTVTGPKGAAAFSQEAYGDVKDRHDPQIAPGGAWRVWAEPETQGESYIPHANDGRRPRARQILEDTASILGARSVEWYAAGGSSESDKAKKDREEARRRAEERRQREEEKRQRQLDKQRTKDLLASDLRDEEEQAALELKDARRRLISARKADRPQGEVNEARLALKQERAEREDMRAERREERLEKAAQMQIDAAEVALRAAEDQVKAADDHLQAAEDMLSSTQQLRDSLASSVSSQFANSLTGGGLAGLDKTLSGDITGGSTMAATLKALVDAGLDTTGDAAGLFHELASSSDLATASQLLAAGPEAIAHYEQQFLARAQINADRGSFVADASYAQMIALHSSAVAVAEAAAAAAQASAARIEAQLAYLQSLPQLPSQIGQAVGQTLNNEMVSAWHWGSKK